MSVLIGVDVGTTSIKAVAFDTEDLAPGATCRVQTPWAEEGDVLDAEGTQEAVRQAVEEAAAETDAESVEAVGVTSMAETGVLVGPDGHALAPPIAWHDPRGEEGRERLEKALGRTVFEGRTGVKLGTTRSAARVLWLRAEGAPVGRAERWWNVAEWAVLGLGGSPLPELSLASRTGWLDAEEGTWWEDALTCSGGRRSWFEADPVVAGTAMGRVRTPSAAHGAVLTVAGHDQLAGAVGVGTLGPGEVFDSCGTAEAMVGALRQRPDRDAVARHVAEGVEVYRHVIPNVSAVLSAERTGIALQRVLALLGVDDGDDLDHRTGSNPNPAIEVRLDDERVVIVVEEEADPGALWRAAAASAAASARDLLTNLESVTGPTERLVAGGGWLRSSKVREAREQVFRQMAVTAVTEPGCRGAAVLAGVACGRWRHASDAPRPADQLDA